MKMQRFLLLIIISAVATEPVGFAGAIRPQQKTSKSAIAVSGKAAGHRTPPVPSPTVSVNGQHFRNSRNPGLRLAVNGGPSTATRNNTAAINGTNMRRKP